MTIFLYSDTHFDDPTIINYERRRFSSTGEMNEFQIARWNERVQDDDIIYHLGDVGNAEYIKRLNGRKFLVKGNHDTEDNDYYREMGFENVYDLPVVLNSFYFLSHEPMYMTTQAPYANIFGHIHSNPMYKSVSPIGFCVCAERLGYAPISLAAIEKAILDERDKMYKGFKATGEHIDMP